MIHHVVHPITPQRRILELASGILEKRNGLCIYPTDTVYGIGACVGNPKALEKLCRLAARNNNTLFSFICADFSEASTYAKIDNSIYKIMKHCLPGPYTFILPATHLVPKRIVPKRTTVGIRIPDNAVCLELVRMLGQPLANISLSTEDTFDGNPEKLSPDMRNEIDIVLDTGIIENAGDSTILDVTGTEPILVRQGKGIWPINVRN
jgi:tRNA threonylcarbamoyl adenosine modification protein (Sua5/YciO/YrdC/YwlC family)